MHRNSLVEISGRAMHTIVRMTLNKANDDPMMQEHDFDGMNSEGRKKVERVQNYGYTSVPLPRDAQQALQTASKIASSVIGAVGGAVGGNVGGILSTVNSLVGSVVEQAKGPAAEGIAVFVGAQRNHPVVIAVDDRRHRPMGMKPGESAQYDDIGQMTILRRIGTFILSLDSPDEKGNNVERMASLRHVEKKKQKRPGTAQPQGGSSSSTVSPGTRDATSGSTGQSQQDYKHEGETVNTEVRATKKDVQILDGDTVVARYDKGSGTWTFNCKMMVIEASDTIKIEAKNQMDLIGHPLKFNGGGPNSTPFQIP